MFENDFADHEYGPASEDERRLIDRITPLLEDVAQEARERLLRLASRDTDTMGEAERLIAALPDLGTAGRIMGEVYFAAQRTQDGGYATDVADCRNAMMSALYGLRTMRDRWRGKHGDEKIDADWVRDFFSGICCPLPNELLDRSTLPDGLTGLADLDGAATAFGTLVDELLDWGAFSILYGVPNSGKSWIALDLGLRVAAGMPWRGKHTNQGNVIYVAAEGAPGLKQRARAWRQHHGIANAPFAIFDGAFDLTTDKDTDRLIELAHAWHAKSLARVNLILLDTMARMIGGENENDGTAMGRLVANIDRIRRQTGAHVCALHHEGKTAGKGPRGHNSAAGAADTIIRVEPGVATVEKQRDGERGQVFPFRIEATAQGGAMLVHCEPAATASAVEVDALPLLVSCVRDASGANKPFRANRAGSLHERRAELPEPLRGMGRDRLRGLVKTAADAKLISVVAGNLVASAVH